MEAAIYAPDGTRYTATQFLELGAAGIAERRHRLICPNSECRAPASFVNRSRDGRGEHFRSREHVSGCEYLSEKGEQAGGDEGRPEDIVTNTGRRLILDLDGGGTGEVNGVPDAENRPGRQTPRHVIDRDSDRVRESDSHRRLRPVLRELVNSEHFRSSNQLVVLPGYPELPVRRFFVPFTRATADRYQDEQRGFWGTISSAFINDQRLLWIRGGHSDDRFRILVPNRVDAFLRHCNVSTVDELRGGRLLVLGLRRKSDRGPYVRVESLAAVAFRAASLDAR